jgi:hypothetical protein
MRLGEGILYGLGPRPHADVVPEPKARSPRDHGSYHAVRAWFVSAQSCAARFEDTPGICTAGERQVCGRRAAFCTDVCHARTGAASPAAQAPGAYAPPDEPVAGRFRRTTSSCTTDTFVQ